MRLQPVASRACGQRTLHFGATGMFKAGIMNKKDGGAFGPCEEAVSARPTGTTGLSAAGNRKTSDHPPRK
eukprot:2407574-Alexandrium_andersonii.AAC.3